VDRALQLLGQMKAEGVERNVHTYSALMNVCIKCGQLQLSLEVYQQMLQVGGGGGGWAVSQEGREVKPAPCRDWELWGCVAG
jgi:pentatricopeptide repeat protein